MEGPIKSYTNKEQLLICLVVNSEILTHRQKKVNKMCKLIKKNRSISNKDNVLFRKRLLK